MISLRVSALLSMMLVAAGTAACKRKKAAEPQRSAVVVTDAAPPDNCPRPDKLAALAAEPGRTVKTSCVSFSMGTSWMAVALGYETATKAQPRLRLIAGGFGDKALAFDLDPAPADEIGKLLASSSDVTVSIKPSRSDSRLVRLGVLGAKAEGPVASEEIASLIELGAHAPPRWLWAGPGNQTTRGDDGCVRTRIVEFERPFGRRIDMFVSTRAQAAGKGPAPADCTGGPGFQDALPVGQTPIKPGRPL